MHCIHLVHNGTLGSCDHDNKPLGSICIKDFLNKLLKDCTIWH